MRNQISKKSGYICTSPRRDQRLLPHEQSVEFGVARRYDFHVRSSCLAVSNFMWCVYCTLLTSVSSAAWYRYHRGRRLAASSAVSNPREQDLVTRPRPSTDPDRFEKLSRGKQGMGCQNYPRGMGIINDRLRQRVKKGWDMIRTDLWDTTASSMSL